MSVVPCNWLQIMENSLDPVHVVAQDLQGGDLPPLQEVAQFAAAQAGVTAHVAA